MTHPYTLIAVFPVCKSQPISSKTDLEMHRQLHSAGVLNQRLKTRKIVMIEMDMDAKVEPNTDEITPDALEAAQRHLFREIREIHSPSNIGPVKYRLEKKEKA